MGYYIGEIVKLRKEFFTAFEEGEYSKAIKCGNDIIDIYKENDDCSGLEYANDINNLAIVYDTVMMQGKAIKLYREAADIREELLGEDSLVLADTLSNLGVACSLKKMFNEAIGLHKRALNIREKNLEGTNEDVIVSLYNMGSANEDLKRYDKAEKYYKDALERAEKQPKISRSDYADILLGNGRIMEKKGIYIKAADFFSKAVDILKMEEGEKSFYYLSSVLDTAEAYENCKIYDKAIYFYKMAVDIRKGILDKTHLDFITNLNSLAAVYRKTGEGMKAFDVHNETLGIIKSLMGENHSFYADCLAGMGKDLYTSGKYDETEKYYQKAMDLKKKDSDDSAGYSLILESYGLFNSEKGDLDKAEQILKEAGDIRREKFGEDSIIYADSLCQRAKIYDKKKLYEKAAAIYKSALEIRLSRESGQNSDLAENYIDIAFVMVSIGSNDYALKYCSEALRVTKKLFGQKHPKYAEMLYKVAMAKRKMHLYKDADKDLNEALAIEEECLGKDSIDTKNTLKEMSINSIFMARDLFENNDSENGMKYFENAVKIYSYGNMEEIENAQKDIAFLYGYIGDSKKGEELLLKYKDLSIEKYGESSREYGEALKYLGEYYVKFSSAQKGEELLFKAMEVFYSLDGEQQQEKGRILIFLGKCFAEKKKFEKAMSYYKAAIPVSEGIDYAETLTGYGYCAIKTGNMEEAKSKLLASKSYMEQYTGTEKPCYSKTAMLLGAICESEGDIENAARYYNLSISKRRITGDKNEEYRKDIIKLGNIYKKIGNKENAADLFKEAAEISKDTNEKVKLFIKCAKLYGEVKKFDYALRLLSKAEEICENEFGENSEERAAVLYEEAIFSAKYGKNEEALYYFEALREVLKVNPESKFADDKYFVKYKKLLGK